jgi:hypothetical protein
MKEVDSIALALGARPNRIKEIKAYRPDLYYTMVEALAAMKRAEATFERLYRDPILRSAQVPQPIYNITTKESK